MVQLKIYKLIFFWLQGKQTGFICSVLILLPLHTSTRMHTHTSNVTLKVCGGCLSMLLSFMPTHSVSVCLYHTNICQVYDIFFILDFHIFIWSMWNRLLLIEWLMQRQREGDQSVVCVNNCVIVNNVTSRELRYAALCICIYVWSIYCIWVSTPTCKCQMANCVMWMDHDGDVYKRWWM